MSDGIKVTSRTFRGQPVPSTQSIDAIYSGDDADWDGTPGEGGFDQWKQPVVAATTGNITIATALNAADTLDGVTLAAGDRVLVKDQSTASQNGIYIVGTTPARADDMDEDAEVVGSVVSVVGGTTNAGTAWYVTNTTDPAVDTDAINWGAFGGATALDDLSDVTITSPTAADRIRYNGSAWVNSTLVWTPVTTFDGTSWLLAVDGSGNAIMTEA